jgi:hypothetical protein
LELLCARAEQPLTAKHHTSALSTSAFVPHASFMLRCAIGFLRFSNRNERAILTFAARNLMHPLAVDVARDTSSPLNRRSRLNLHTENFRGRVRIVSFKEI